METTIQLESPAERADSITSMTSVQSVLRHLTVGSTSHGSMDLPLSPSDGEKISRGRLSTRFAYVFVQLVEIVCICSVLRTTCIDQRQISYFQLDKSGGTLLNIRRQSGL